MLQFNVAKKPTQFNPLPAIITILGKQLKPTVRGDYPYDCADKDKYPSAMIYKGDGCWTHEYADDFKTATFGGFGLGVLK